MKSAFTEEILSEGPQDRANHIAKSEEGCVCDSIHNWHDDPPDDDGKPMDE